MQTVSTIDRRAFRSSGGFSLLEALVTVAIVGILGAIAMTALRGVVPGARRTVAVEVLETLNQAVSKFSQIHGSEIQNVVADDDSAAEELAIVRALQWRSPVLPDPGAPFLRIDYNPQSSGSAEDYRLIWNGEYFEILEPGTDGVGLRVMFDASDTGEPVVFPNGFVPLGGIEST